MYYSMFPCRIIALIITELKKKNKDSITATSQYTDSITAKSRYLKNPLSAIFNRAPWLCTYRGFMVQPIKTTTNKYPSGSTRSLNR